MRPKIIAISGWKRSGKDTASNYLTQGYGATRVSLADPLKDMASAEYGVPREHFDSDLHKEAPILSLPVEPKDAFTNMLTVFLAKEFRTLDRKAPVSVRIQDQKLLTEDRGQQLYWTPRALAILKGSGNRAVSSSYWVDQTVSKINQKIASGANPPLFIIPDLRFQSEVQQLKEAFGADLVTIRVQRFETSPSLDPSERDLDHHEFDYHLPNTGTLDDLHRNIQNLLARIF